MLEFPIVRAVFDSDGRPVGFYPEPIWTAETVPPEAIEIPYGAYVEFLEFQGQRRWNGSQAVPCSPPLLRSRTAEEEADLARIGKETKRLHAGVASAVAAWASLENSLAHLLSAIVTQNGGALGLAIYYSPNATETRIDILKTALGMWLRAHPEKDERERVKSSWESLLAMIRRLKSTRNKIVHGNISTINIRGGNHVRLTPPIFDFSRFTMFSDDEGSKKMGRWQVPGLDPHDVEVAAIGFAEVSTLITHLRKAVVFLSLPPSERGPLPQIFHELEAGLKARRDRSTGGQSW